MTEQCKKRVFSGARHDMGGHRCSRKAVAEGYCAQHHPEAEKARALASHARWASRYEIEKGAFERKQAREKATKLAIEALRNLVRAVDSPDEDSLFEMAAAREALAALDAAQEGKHEAP
jgi:hypothetical protein